MRFFNAGLCAIVVVFLCVAFNTNATPLSGKQQQKLVGAKKCTWGPSYWCNNLSNAKDCRAVKHCIQTIWEKHDVPQDNDSICKICKDMVSQARDQLRSNETMDEMRQVFEGSCNLIPIKVIKKECSKLADDFIPELVEALSSQMNPDQVCSVAGLCNNAEIDKILQQTYADAIDGTLTEASSSEVVTKSSDIKPEITKRGLSCGNCSALSNFMVNKFKNTNRDDILENLLYMCGTMSSFSDACSNIVLTYFNDMYEYMKQHMDSKGLCHLSGVCAYKYHQHDEDTKDTEIVVKEISGDDIPCELCEQLVHHLRDLLVANTTEAEFKQVLDGLCKQAQGFKEECLSIVDQYYHIIYDTLVNNLDANSTCFLMGVCPKGNGKMIGGPIMPLVPAIPPAKIEVSMKKLGSNEPKFTQDEIMSMALPIDHLMGAANPNMLVQGGELCTLCEYFLHFIQESLATPATEDEIKEVVNSACNKFPASIRGQCHNFIDMYGDAVLALLIQGLNPTEICPKLQICPRNNEKHIDMEVFHPVIETHSDKPTCPLCLFAVEQAQQKIKNEKTKENIKSVLDNLCTHLPDKLHDECADFVQTYSSELIDMLITDFKPQEICVELKLCPKTNDYLDELGIAIDDKSSDEFSAENSAFNEIDSSDEMPLEVSFGIAADTVTPNCLLCEEIVKTAEKRIKPHTTKEDIKRALEHSCEKFKKTIQVKCHKYVERYGDTIATLLLKELEPKMICTEIGLCLISDREDLEIDEAVKYVVIALPKENKKFERLTNTKNEIHVKDLPSCVLCEFIMSKLGDVLSHNATVERIEHVIQSICIVMPQSVENDCHNFIHKYSKMIVSLMAYMPPKQICSNIMVCLSRLDTAVNDEVIECGVCHGASQALLPYLRNQKNHDISIQDMISVACENLPAKYNSACANMISIYGISFINISEKPYMDVSHVCSQIGKCFDSEKSVLAFAKISA